MKWVNGVRYGEENVSGTSVGQYSMNPGSKVKSIINDFKNFSNSGGNANVVNDIYSDNDPSGDVRLKHLSI